MLALLKAENVNVPFMPTSCIGELHPSGVSPSPNQVFKDAIKAEFNTWCTGKIDLVKELVKAWNEGTLLEDIEINLMASAMKPIHAR